MTTKTKANPDYNQSAVSLTNAAEVKTAYAEYCHALGEQAFLEEKLQASDLYKVVQVACKTSAEQLLKLKAAVEQYGGYQDTERGEYALKQKRVSVSYSPEKVREFIPDYSFALIEEVVNKDKVQGLLTGRLITPDQVEKIIGERKTTEAWIIK